MIGRFLTSGKAFEACAIDEENVEPAVVVVIIESDTTTSGLQKEFILVLAAEKSLGMEARFTSNVHKSNSEFRFRRRDELA